MKIKNIIIGVNESSLEPFEMYYCPKTGQDFWVDEECKLVPLRIEKRADVSLGDELVLIGGVLKEGELWQEQT